MNNTRLIRLPEVRHRVGLHRATIYRLIKKGEFPAPVILGVNSRAWPEHVVEEWIKGRIRADL